MTAAPSPLTIVTELCEGGDLCTYIGKQEIPQGAMNEMLLGIARGILLCSAYVPGIHHLHENQVIHRDISARNVLVTS